MAVVQTGDNKWAVARYIVDPTAGQGTHTTIAAAMADAVSGDVIAVRQGTYTEDFTMTPGVTLTTMGGGEYGGVTVVGKVTMSGAGTSTIFGMRLQTNSDFAVAVTGSAASILVIENSFINCTNNTGISSTSSGGSFIKIKNCEVDLATTGISYFSISGSGTLFVFYCFFMNTGASSTASTMTNTSNVSFNNTLISLPITSSDTSRFSSYNSRHETFSTNSTSLTLNGTGNNIIVNGQLSSGTASTISVGAGATLLLTNTTVSSSNTNAISGLGTLDYTPISFSGASSNISVTTQNLLYFGPSALVGSSNTGNTNTLRVSNASNTASSSANIVSTVGGSTAADPTYQAAVSGVTTWTWGIDNSVTSPTADPFVIAQGNALGTNNIMSVATTGEINYPLQPAFLAYLASNALNKTGAGAVYQLGTDALTEVYDQNSDFNTNGIFTAPVTGRYKLDTCIGIQGNTIATTFLSQIVTSNRTFQNQWSRDASAVGGSIWLSVQVDMDVGDTAVSNVQVSGEAADTSDIIGAGALTFFAGYLFA